MVADLTPVGSPYRVECDLFGDDFRRFWPLQAVFVVREPLCHVGIASQSLITLLRFIKLKQSDWLRNSVTPVRAPDRVECDIF